jgi:predicted  nucleic acid-binding Zn-ribbon protein
LDSFVGPGFLRVSPAWEAQAKYHADHGDEALARRRRAASRMDELRSELRCLIEAGAGRQHLVQVADEARAIVRRRLLPVSDLIATHRVPVTELASQQAGLEAALEELGKAIVDTENQLTEDVDRRIRQAQRTFDPLRKMLHQELDPVIRDGDLNDKHLNEISTCYVRCFERFMTAAGGPATTWKRHLDELVEHCEAAMRQIAGTTGTQTLVTVEPLDLSLFPFEAGRGRPVGVYALVRATAATVGLAGSITGGATWLVSAMALNPLFVVPGGIAAGAALFTMVAVRAYRDRETNLQRDRREWIERLDQQAEATRHQFAAIAREQGQLIIDTVKENLKAYQSRLEAAARQITERMGAHDIASSRDVIDRLEPLEDEGKAIVAALARSDS